MALPRVPLLCFNHCCWLLVMSVILTGRSRTYNERPSRQQGFKQSSNFWTSVLKFEFDLHIFSIQISDLICPLLSRSITHGCFHCIDKAIKISRTSWTTRSANHLAPFSAHGGRPRPLLGSKQSSNKIRILQKKFEWNLTFLVGSIPLLSLLRRVIHSCISLPVLYP